MDRLIDRQITSLMDRLIDRQIGRDVNVWRDRQGNYTDRQIYYSNLKDRQTFQTMIKQIDLINVISDALSGHNFSKNAAFYSNSSNRYRYVCCYLGIYI